MTRTDRNALWVGIGMHAAMLVGAIAFQVWMLAGWSIYWGAWSWTQLRRGNRGT